VDNYQLAVQSGSGYKLNVSLFERLVLAGFPHATLEVQVRGARFERASLVRRVACGGCCSLLLASLPLQKRPLAPNPPQTRSTACTPAYRRW
jgi:hypothetical protein